jgi:hypothetical protein
MTKGNEMKNSESFENLIGFSHEKIDEKELKQLIINAFIYHEKMADVSINTINRNDSEGITMSNKSALWQSFETNNTISYALRDILSRSAGIKQD